MESSKGKDPQGDQRYPLVDHADSRGIRVMLGAISVGFGVMGSIGAWWRFADLFLPLRILVGLGALLFIFIAAWIFFAFAWFHVWPISDVNRLRLRKHNLPPKSHL